jgi:hypothetical protein
VRFIGAGFKEELPPGLRTAVVLEHDVEAGTLTCHFKHLADLPRIPDEPLVINELHYDPPPEQGNNWSFIELYNRGTEPYDLSGASFSSGVDFTFPDNTVVDPGEYILVAADPDGYAGLGVEVFDYAGSEKPNSDKPMWLRDRRGLEIDYVSYGVTDPWPSEPDNLGPSLMLIDSGLDNTLVTSWATSDQDGGTPGRINIEPPTATGLAFAETVTTVGWSGVVVDGWYLLDYTPTLSPPDWQPAGPTVQADSTSIQLNDSNLTGIPERYFRLTRWFPPNLDRQ